MRGTYYPASDGGSWLPIRLILTANYNAAHGDHLHVEAVPKQYGTPPLTNPGMSDNMREVYDAIEEYFPHARMGVYKRRKIAGTNRWSQHSWANAIDVYASGVAGQQPIYDMLTSPTKPEGGVDVKEVFARLQAVLIRAGYDLGNFTPYLPDGDPDSLPGADGEPGGMWRAAWARFAADAQDSGGVTEAEVRALIAGTTLTP